MGYLNSRQLTLRVTLQEKTTTQDAWGQPLQTWVTVANVWANTKVQTGMGYINNEFNTGGTEVSRTTTSFRIRKRADVVAGMRLLVGSAVYDIRAVLPDLEDNRYLDLGCATGANDG